jgi:hypothetical protein
LGDIRAIIILTTEDLLTEQEADGSLVWLARGAGEAGDPFDSALGRLLVPLVKTRDFGMTPEGSKIEVFFQTDPLPGS